MELGVVSVIVKSDSIVLQVVVVLMVLRVMVVVVLRISCQWMMVQTCPFVVDV